MDNTTTTRPLATRKFYGASDAAETLPFDQVERHLLVANAADTSEQAKVDTDFAPPLEPNTLREVFAGQCHLLARRSELGLPLDRRSLVNLVRVFFALAEAENAPARSVVA